ncbi:NUDIX domain-containing protein [Halodurantibacterium flavum]|uniref:Putative gamma-glutamylcyclotransferase n=1 Tax=Halodurantibacterium flavum TaxID=1382802 RepID=A0ABW4SBL7_9RHOB
MTSFFFYGTLRHEPLLRAVLGREVVTEPALLADYRVHAVADQDFPMILAEPGATATGVLARDLGPGDIERLDYYEGGFGYDLRQVSVGGQAAQIWVPRAGLWQPAGDWDLAAWAERWGTLQVAAAEDAMALRADRPVAELARRWPKVQVRASARLRARGSDAPAEAARLGAAGTPEAADIRIAARHEPYANFFSVEEYDLSYPRYDGAMSPVVNRAVFVTGDAATVLPYDQARDRVLVIEQFRVGPFARGDGRPWLLEPIAGRVDAQEDPETAIRREAEEEAGITLGALHPVGTYYPTPAAKSEFLYSYVALADLPDGAARAGGLDEEAEDIRPHLLTFSELMALVDEGALTNGPLLLSALWLARHRDRLLRNA